MTQYTPLASIKISPKRQRKEFKEAEIQELKTSIEETGHGLLHPIVVRCNDGELWLVAGERRLRAISDIYALGGTFWHNDDEVPEGMVPYTLLGDLSPADAWQAELEENIRRVDLTWPERAAATSEWMEMRSEQAAERGQPAPTVRQIADEVKADLATPQGRIETTRKELIVSRFLHDPDVKAASTVNEAFKVIKKKEEQKQNSALALAVGKTFSSAKHTLLNESAWEFLDRTAIDTFDIILSDPPYGMGADEFGDSGSEGTAIHAYDDSYPNWVAIMNWFIPLTFTRSKENAAMYLFCDIDRFHELKMRAAQAGWAVFRTPLIWHNTDGFRAPWPERGPQRKYECILYAVKGTRKVTKIAGDVLTYGRDQSLGHPAQKPVDLLIDLLRRVAKPGEHVFDGFAGSGATIEAANELMLTCTATEIDVASYGIAAKRLQGLKENEANLFEEKP